VLPLSVGDRFQGIFHHAEKNERAIKVVAENRKARFNYAIEDTVEAESR